MWTNTKRKALARAFRLACAASDSPSHNNHYWTCHHPQQTPNVPQHKTPLAHKQWHKKAQDHFRSDSSHVTVPNAAIDAKIVGSVLLYTNVYRCALMYTDVYCCILLYADNCRAWWVDSRKGKHTRPPTNQPLQITVLHTRLNEVQIKNRNNVCKHGTSSNSLDKWIPTLGLFHKRLWS